MTDEKSSSISRHKATISKQPGGAPVQSFAQSSAQSFAQSFDIIPASKVMPSSNARPVIAPSRPAQADNTLIQTALTPSAPLIEKIQKSVDIDIDSADKKSFMTTPPQTSAQPGDTLLEAPPVKSAPEAPDAALSQAAVGRTVTELLADKTHSLGERTIVPPIHDATTGKDAAAVAAPPETPAPDSVAEIFANENSQGRSSGHAEHSEGFKEAIQELDTSPEGKHPYHQTSEAALYGGKPVIVIHEPHPLRSVFTLLLWFIICLVLLFVALNFLLDAGVVSTSLNIPHTNVLEP